MRGLCPVCDREELNREEQCGICGNNVRVGKFMMYHCEECGESFEACLECFEAGRSHNEDNCGD